MTCSLLLGFDVTYRIVLSRHLHLAAWSAFLRESLRPVIAAEWAKAGVRAVPCACGASGYPEGSRVWVSLVLPDSLAPAAVAEIRKWANALPQGRGIISSRCLRFATLHCRASGLDLMRGGEAQPIAEERLAAELGRILQPGWRLSLLTPTLIRAEGEARPFWSAEDAANGWLDPLWQALSSQGPEPVQSVAAWLIVRYSQNQSPAPAKYLGGLVGSWIFSQPPPVALLPGLARAMVKGVGAKSTFGFGELAIAPWPAGLMPLPWRSWPRHPGADALFADIAEDLRVPPDLDAERRAMLAAVLTPWAEIDLASAAAKPSPAVLPQPRPAASDSPQPGQDIAAPSAEVTPSEACAARTYTALCKPGWENCLTVILAQPDKRIRVEGEELVIADAEEDDDDEVSESHARSRRIPWSAIRALVIMPGVTPSGGVFRRAAERMIPVVFLDNACLPLANLLPDKVQLPDLHAEQDRAFADQARTLQLARRIISAKIANQAEVMRRNDKADVVAELRRLAKQARGAATISTLRGIEGSAAGRYWRAWQSLARPFAFAGRQPQGGDPINCLLDIGYSVLRRRIAASLHLAGIDMRKALFHAESNGHAALASDLMEPYRCTIDLCILAMVHRQQIKPSDFSAGRPDRKVFLKSFLMFEQAWLRPASAQCKDTTIGGRIDHEGQALARWLQGQEYKPWCLL